MELGNAIFGNSRGKYEIVARRQFEDVFIPFLKKIGLDERGYSEDGWDKEYATFNNDTFLVRPYYWGEDEYICSLPNFVYKPTGLEIQWYKWPFRDSYINQEMPLQQFEQIIEHCLNSVRKDK